jgi:hypothetical protein
MYVVVKGAPSLGKRLEGREKRYLLDEVYPPVKLIIFILLPLEIIDQSHD